MNQTSSNMKTVKQIARGLATGVAFSLALAACQTNPEVTPQEDLLPTNFKVDIPSAISNSNMSNGRAGGRTEGDTLKGNDIYVNLGTFIAVGEGAADVVQNIITGIRRYKIDRIQSLTYISDDDSRTKNLVVVSNSEFEGKTWEYQLTVTDADSEGNSDGGKAMEVFWNHHAPIEGIAIIKPYNADRTHNAEVGEAMFRVDYSEVAQDGYEARMEVRISGLPQVNPLENPYAISTLWMFAGKTGDVVDVYGNSNHPNAVFFSGEVGFDWAFVASGNDPKNIGVAEVGLPPSSLDESDRTVLLKDYSIKNVFTSEITAVWPGLDPAVLNAYLSNTAAPGYFSNKGFISGGVSPGADWDPYAARLDNLSPYNPAQVSSLEVVFK